MGKYDDERIQGSRLFEGRHDVEGEPLTNYGEPRPAPASQFALDLADALANPIVRTLLIGLIREAIRSERSAESARAQSQQQPQPAPLRGSKRTAWVGIRARQEAERQAQAQQQTGEGQT